MSNKELSIPQIEYLKCLIDDAILETSEDYEPPCFFHYAEISEKEYYDLESLHYIDWHDGPIITKMGEEAYHENKHKLSYHKFINRKTYPPEAFYTGADGKLYIKGEYMEQEEIINE